MFKSFKNLFKSAIVEIDIADFIHKYGVECNNNAVIVEFCNFTGENVIYIRHHLGIYEISIKRTRWEKYMFNSNGDMSNAGKIKFGKFNRIKWLLTNVTYGSIVIYGNIVLDVKDSIKMNEYY